jgi:N-acyl amino acid synthase of PEP-CTERM/exosortase system
VDATEIALAGGAEPVPSGTLADDDPGSSGTRPGRRACVTGSGCKSMQPLQSGAELEPRLDFETIIADTDAARHIHYALRYHVYCLETGFEDPGAHDCNEEKDRYDAEAIHFLVRCLSSGDWVAAARLIVRRDKPLPVESYCPLDPELLNEGAPPGGEVSRLLILRASPGGSLIPDTGSSRPETRTRALWQAAHYRSEILRRVLIGLLTRARELGVQDVAYFLTPALQRIIQRLGITFRVVGEPCEHRGTRYPCLSSVAGALEDLYAYSRARNLPAGEPYHLFSRWS